MAKRSKTDFEERSRATDAAGSDNAGDNTILETDRLAMKHPVLECIKLLANKYGRRTSLNALSSGLPIKDPNIPPSLIKRAAERAKLQAELSAKPLRALKKNVNLPCILILDDQQACVLRSITRDRKNINFNVEFPETPGKKRVLSESDLKSVYSGYVWFIRPEAKLDERAGPAALNPDRSDWFWSAIWKNKIIYSEVGVASLFINIFALISPLFIMNVYDRIIPNEAFESLWTLAIGVTIAFTFDLLLKNLRAFFIDVAGRRSDVRISAVIFENILGMKLAEKPASAGVLTSHMKEFETIRDFFTSSSLVTVIDLPFAIIFLTLIYIIAGPVAFVPMLAVPIILIVGWISQRKLNKIIAQSMMEASMKSALMFEAATGLETIKVQAAEGHMQRRWEELNEQASKTTVKSKQVMAKTLNWASYIQQMSVVVMVVVGTYLFADQALSLGALIAAIILTSRALAPFTNIASLMVRYNQTKQAMVQLDDLMAKDIERPSTRKYITKDKIEGHIEFRNVRFAYPGQTTLALHDVHFEIKPGEKVGVIGAVGSGKTTLERLILNLYEPESGSVLIDRTDVRQIDPGDLRRQIGVVQQDPQLFYGSVRDNITLGHETVSEKAVIRAAEMAGVMNFLRESQHGLDTQVGERGEALSGGQRQAVAIARALLYDPQIIIMDEPTASIDPASEQRLKNHLKDICVNRTVLLITHKMTLLDLVEKILLMDRAKILDFDNREAVMDKLRQGKYES